MWQIKRLGRIDYNEALDYQNYLVNLKHAGLKDDFLLLLEHNPVYTMGKGSDKENILDSDIPVIVTNRGGDLTYHGPGQLIGYIIMDLKSKNYDIHRYLRKIEDLIINVMVELELSAYKIPKLTGVWSGEKKIASIGIGVKRGITMHGFALNINPDLINFAKINPCGLDYRLISSIKELKKTSFSPENIENLIIQKFLEIFTGD